MKRSVTTTILLAGFVVSLAIMLYSCGGGGSMYGSSSTPAATTTVQAVACPTSGTTDVSIISMTVGFSPASVTVPVNSVVKWTNTDSTTHTVTSTTVPLYGTFDMQVNPGVSACFKFTSAGTFNYHCTIHPTMPTGVVVVQ